MSNPVTLGLVGLGGYAQRHLTNIRTAQGAGLCELRAVADPFAVRHPEVSAALRAQGVAVYDDAAQLFDREDVEAVILATPIPLHFPQAMEALGAGKHVYLEKPPCVTLQELDQLLQAQAQSGTVCAVGFQQQASPSLRFAKEQLTGGELGKVQRIWASIRWSRGDAYYDRAPWAARWRVNSQPVYDGPATNALSHVVHAALFLAGAGQDQWARVRRVRGCLKKARPVESYDSIFLEVETVEGVRVSLAFTHATESHDEAMIHCAGENGRLTVDWKGRINFPERTDQARDLWFVSEPHVTTHLDFLRAIRQPEYSPSTTLENVRPYLQATNGALQSSLKAYNHTCPSFAEESIHQVGEGGMRFHCVEGLDDEFLRFAQDGAVPPSLLTPGDWIEADAIAGHLAV